MHNERESGPSADELRAAILDHLRYSLGRGEHRRPQAPDLHRAAALAVRDVLVDGLLRSARRQQEAGVKRICYLSMEFLLGRSLENNLENLGLLETFREALGDLREPDEVLATEPDAGLGNGGLGRLAACYLDSMATLGLAGTGYGISYEFGMFRQEIDRGRQREKPDRWMAGGTPWLVERTDESCLVPAYGRVEDGVDRDGHYNPLWMDWRTLVGVPHDMSIVGWRGRTVNRLRLFAARASDDFDTAIFNEGDYIRAVEQKVASETVSKVLYPSDRSAAGRELRLLQEYFLVACALRDLVRRELSEGADLRELPRRVAIQLNDTHPALAVVELMRILVDEHGLDWDSAWKATVGTCAYTNHTLMPEALETWPVTLIEKVLPRHLQILYEVNRRFLDGEVAVRWPGDLERRRRMSLVGEEGERHVRMANLAIVGSHAVNGVAALHSNLIRTRLVPDFAALWPERFSNKTNGVTPRRWLRVANPGLASLVTRALGDERWVSDLELLRGLERFAADGSFREEFRGIKRANKDRLAALLAREARVRCDPAALFDVQVKRIHEYKRQLLNVLQILVDYLRIVEDGVVPPVARVCVIAGKAAPGYHAAKEIIRIVHAVAEVVNGDKRVRDLLRVAFVPDYRVSLAERIIPAADISQQISTAGTEASGTSNMKLALNGALTLGTLDGANIEIREAVGAENFFLFGLSTDEVRQVQDRGYEPATHAAACPELTRALELLANGGATPRDPELGRWAHQRLLSPQDQYLHLADFASYDAQRRASATLYADREDWATKAILNVARCGRFSSDRSVEEYAREIWGAEPPPGYER